MNRAAALLVGTMLLLGCAGRGPSYYQLTVDDYVAAAPQVHLDMSKAEVVEIMQPSQGRLKNTDIKQPDMYRKAGVLVEIIYFRSGWQADGITTDDEFTPYLFNDGKLVAVGWATLGGPRSQGQAISETHIYTTIPIYPGHHRSTIVY